jgi:hypothetical protein
MSEKAGSSYVAFPSVFKIAPSFIKNVLKLEFEAMYDQEGEVQLAFSPDRMIAMQVTFRVSRCHFYTGFCVLASFMDRRIDEHKVDPQGEPSALRKGFLSLFV